jgi:hypothetical protein
MSILGKLLIVLNLLAAGAFTYLTVQDRKVRKDLTRMAIVREIQLNGVPVEASRTVEGTEKVDEGYVPFRRDVYGHLYESIPMATLAAAIPRGDEDFGGEPVADQTAEVNRVQKKVFANIAAKAGEDQNQKLQWLRAYALALARSGAERDGVSAIFDMRDPSRAYYARRDLPLAARTESQTAALRALIDVANLGDPQAIPEATRPAWIAATREAIKRFAVGEAEHAAADEEGRRRLKNAVLAAFQQGAGEAEKNAIAQAATEPFKTHGAAVCVESLADKASADRAATELIEYAMAKRFSQDAKAEAAAIQAIAKLIRLPAGGNPNADVDAAGTNWLTAQFEEAAQPASSKAAPGGDPVAAKARKIAHLLYHIDGWRHFDPTAAPARKAWHERVAAIVGLPAYIRAAESQATEYAEAAQRLVAVITEEQSAFEAQYHAQLQKILFLYSQWLALDSQLKAQEAITAENVRLLNERKTERDRLLEELAKARADAKASLDKLTKTQKDLFTIQKQLRDAHEALFVLEKQLEQLESKAVNEATRK